jgi:hypothetical protein
MIFNIISITFNKLTPTQVVQKSTFFGEVDFETKSGNRRRNSGTDFLVQYFTAVSTDKKLEFFSFYCS